ncbi:50S ribosomal subunit L30 [Eremomyces bilateralis CBS 781.70]|uniref:Large ribosomal subunit protein mL46 n=1 Tax=Eremomyces bilateralis CBS 781.70 TaxID=1392243 RepID=A0A6G1FT20_9PEZI|nr:50S ribosomal subunit L30 [Eremomyces bilateralis CBS 781.70]KAF1808821.1 50S ribosomal subunit L30 [Eremomyces bilateralis CBS 781.70]
MSVGQRVSRQLGLRRVFDDGVCSSCRRSLTQQRSASTATATTESHPPILTTMPPVTQTSLPTGYQLRASVVLSRPPQITRDLHPFEKSFFLYQRRLNERLVLPFSRYFYYRKGTPADLDWKRKVAARLSASRDVGAYSGYGANAWADEALVGAPESEPEHTVQKLIEDAEVSAVKPEELGHTALYREPVERPQPRETRADREGDERSLDRELKRTLYLVMREASGKWAFPEDSLVGTESLRQAALRILPLAGGPNMNTWVVGNAPLGKAQTDYSAEQYVQNTARAVEEVGKKVFFMKARIMAGEVDMAQNKFGHQEYKWLTKDELQKVVHQRYWSNIKNFLPEW